MKPSIMSILSSPLSKPVKVSKKRMTEAIKRLQIHKKESDERRKLDMSKLQRFITI